MIDRSEDALQISDATPELILNLGSIGGRKVLVTLLELLRITLNEGEAGSQKSTLTPNKVGSDLRFSLFHVVGIGDVPPVDIVPPITPQSAPAIAEIHIDRIKLQALVHLAALPEERASETPIEQVRLVPDVTDPPVDIGLVRTENIGALPLARAIELQVLQCAQYLGWWELLLNDRWREAGQGEHYVFLDGKPGETPKLSGSAAVLRMDDRREHLFRQNCFREAEGYDHEFLLAIRKDEYIAAMERHFHEYPEARHPIAYSVIEDQGELARFEEETLIAEGPDRTRELMQLCFDPKIIKDSKTYIFKAAAEMLKDLAHRGIPYSYVTVNTPLVQFARAIEDKTGKLCIQIYSSAEIGGERVFKVKVFNRPFAEGGLKLLGRA